MAADPQPRRDFTPAQLEAVLHAALQAGDVRGVEAALTVLAIKDPRRAELLYQTIRVGLAITQDRDNTNTEEN